MVGLWGEPDSLRSLSAGYLQMSATNSQLKFQKKKGNIPITTPHSPIFAKNEARGVRGLVIVISPGGFFDYYKANLGSFVVRMIFWSKINQKMTKNVFFELLWILKVIYIHSFGSILKNENFYFFGHFCDLILSFSVVMTPHTFTLFHPFYFSVSSYRHIFSYDL